LLLLANIAGILDYWHTFKANLYDSDRAHLLPEVRLTSYNSTFIVVLTVTEQHFCQTQCQLTQAVGESWQNFRMNPAQKAPVAHGDGPLLIVHRPTHQPDVGLSRQFGII
jgi:hypothetical protein